MYIKKITYIGIIIGLLSLLLTLIIFNNNKNKNTCYPKLILKGKRIIELKMNDEYKEDGYKVIDKCGRKVTVQVQNNINYDTPGTYEIIYTATNKYKNETSEKRFVNIAVDSSFMYKDEYDKIDNKIIGWGMKNNKDRKRPDETKMLLNKLTKYNTYFIGPDKKTIYLTFDEGSNATYLDEIVDILNENYVKATFFFCRRYILDNKDLMKKLVKSGHSVGNHTADHYEMTKYSNRENFNKFLDQIFKVEKAFKDVTGVSMEKIYREPRGEYSFRNLQIIKDMGYKNYFWSATYLDFANNVSKEKAFNELTARVHNGAIYLIHPKNKGNYEALDSFIKYIKKEGYTFDLVKNI